MASAAINPAGPAPITAAVLALGDGNVLLAEKRMKKL
jgi:hypothetical protein